jgi:transposase-like protein
MYCGHFQTNKRGKTRRGTEEYQRYICKKCKKSFSELTGTIYEDRHLTPNDIDLIIQYQNQGMNFTQVAKKVGVSRKSVANLLKTTDDNTIDRPNDSIQSVERVREASRREARRQGGRQTPSIMIKIKCLLILLASLFGISGCLSTTAGKERTASISNSIDIDGIKPNLDSVSLADKTKSDTDLYETKYIFCDSYCADRSKRAATTTTIATWGKPTEIGFMYAEQYYPQSMAFNPRKKIVYNSMTITNLQAQLVIKSRGLVPPFKQPLGISKFTPVSTVISMFFPEKVNAPLMAEAKGSVNAGNLKILSVRKLSPTEADIYIKKAKNHPNLATIGAIEESLYKEIQTYAAYYEFYKDKPDIKPQQVEKISPQVNVIPQVIQVKKW